MSKDKEQRPSDSEAIYPNERIVFAIAFDAENVPVLILGIPRACYERMAQGQTSHLDFTPNSAGSPLPPGTPVMRAIIFGGLNKQACLDMLASGGQVVTEYSDADFGIQPKKEPS